jgi:hypothetical protein
MDHARDGIPRMPYFGLSEEYVKIAKRRGIPAVLMVDVSAAFPKYLTK